MTFIAGPGFCEWRIDPRPQTGPLGPKHLCRGGRRHGPALLFPLGVLWGRVGQERPELQGSKEAGSRKAETRVALSSCQQSLRWVLLTMGPSVYPQTVLTDKEELSREPREENRRTAKLTEQITHLQAEEVLSLHIENAQLKSEIQQLQLKLQIQREMCKEHVLQLEGKWAEQETPCEDGEAASQGMWEPGQHLSDPQLPQEDG